MEIDKSTQVAWSINQETMFVYFYSSFHDYFPKRMIDKAFDYMY